jgi:hypothetical protein
MQAALSGFNAARRLHAVIRMRKGKTSNGKPGAGHQPFSSRSAHLNGPNPLSIELGSEILSSSEFAFGLTSSSAQPQGQQGFGICVSIEVSAVVGVLAGADIVS